MSRQHHVAFSWLTARRADGEGLTKVLSVGCRYWCANPPRDISVPGAAVGVFVNPKLLPNAFTPDGAFRSDYNTSGAVLRAWRLEHW